VAAFLDRKPVFTEAAEGSLPVFMVSKADIEAGRLPDEVARWAKANGFFGEAGRLLTVPGTDGALAGAVFGLGDRPEERPLDAGKLATALPKGRWHLAGATAADALAALGYGLGGYRFDTYRTTGRRDVEGGVSMALPDGLDGAELERQITGSFIARDLINTPANDMGPDALEGAFRALADRFDADVRVVKGDALLAQNFPMIHAVGRASTEAPRLLEMRRGRAGAPKVTLVGKGVCFDTGGLDIKPSAAMLLMKKDMGGAANVLGLAHMIMDAGLKVRLRVLIPAVENAISGAAFRPGDVFRSRKGLTVEIGNTDAEGRLVLADALSLAAEERPEILVDMATLTGAARVALGPEIVPFYTRDDALAATLAGHAEAVADPVWRLPLWQPYLAMLDSRIADINNAGSAPFAGSITAALFLSRFVPEDQPWLHADIYAWNPKDGPGRPEGGEAQAIRALYALLESRYGA
jgi:leucyl aminopeptidase